MDASLSGALCQSLPAFIAAISDTPPAQMTFSDLVKSAEWVLVPIGFLSFAIISLVIFNLFFLRKSRVANDAFISLANRLLNDGNMEAMFDLCTKSDQYCAKVLSKVIIFARENRRTNVENLQKIAESEGSALAVRLNVSTLLLMDLGVLAPMVGLLGTVYGILRSFGNLAADPTPMKTMVLAGGVSQALISTALGLGIGLIAMMFYAFFRARVQLLIGYFEQTLTPLLAKTLDRLSGE